MRNSKTELVLYQFQFQNPGLHCVDKKEESVAESAALAINTKNFTKKDKYG